MSKRIFTLFFMLVLVSAGFAQKKEVDYGQILLDTTELKKSPTCTVEHPLSACHPIAYFPLSNPSFHFSVDYCCSNNSKCSASLS